MILELQNYWMIQRICNDRFKIKGALRGLMGTKKVKIPLKSCCPPPGPPPEDAARRGQRGSRRSLQKPTVR